MLTVVIPTHKRAELVRACISALCRDSPENVEVLVVEDRSEVAEAALRDFIDAGQVTYLRNDGPKGGASFARNLGAAAAKGEYLLFLDDDDQLDERYLAQVLRVISAARPAWGFGLQRVDGTVARLKGAWGKEISEGVLGAQLPLRRRVAALSSGLFVRRDLFLAVVGLDSDQTVDEDTDFCCRLIGAGHDPYFMATIATELNRDAGVVRLTTSQGGDKVAECYARTFWKNIDRCEQQKQGAAYLAERAVRMLLRADEREKAMEVVARVRSPMLRVALRLKIWRKSR